MDGFFVFFRTGIPSKILYLSLLITGVLVLVGRVLGVVKDKRNFTLWILLIEYLFVVICSTIIFRGTLICKFDRVELTPFWTYQSIINRMPGVSCWDVVLNVVLFIPLGFLVKMIYPSISALKIFAIAVLFSLIIEANQYFFEKGVVQIDDVVHNVIGAFTGWLFAKFVMQWINKV